MSRNRISFTSNTKIEEPTVNLTPLIDVVFVILIMFIVIAPLLEMDRIELAEGPSTHLASTSSVQDASPITIHVHQNNTIVFNNRPISISQLAEKLAEAKLLHPNTHPHVFLDKQAHFGTYQNIKNIVEEAGFSSLDIILKPS